MVPATAEVNSTESGRVRPTTPAPRGERWQPVLTKDADLRAGGEWASSTLRFLADDLICLRCDSEVKFYAGLFEESEYQSKAKGWFGFKFEWGSDRSSFEKAVLVGAPADYRVVLRIGNWARAGLVSATLWKAAPLPVVVTPPQAQRRDWRFYGVITTAAVLAGVTLLAVWYDIVVVGWAKVSAFWTVVAGEAVLILFLYGVIRKWWRRFVSAS